MTSRFRERILFPNVLCNKVIVSMALQHVSSSCWDHMPSKSISINSDHSRLPLCGSDVMSPQALHRLRFQKIRTRSVLQPINPKSFTLQAFCPFINFSRIRKFCFSFCNSVLQYVYTPVRKSINFVFFFYLPIKLKMGVVAKNDFLAKLNANSIKFETQVQAYWLQAYVLNESYTRVEPNLP